MKVIISGGREYDDYESVSFNARILLSKYPDLEIVSGGANGADSLGEFFAEENALVMTRFPANWNKHGKSAGYIRNKQMAEYADALIAFWDGESKGTANMIKLAKENRLKVKIIRYEK